MRTVFIIGLLGFSVFAKAQELDFNSNWKFTLSDSVCYSFVNYNPQNWRTVDLPHDWSIELPFGSGKEGCTAYLAGGIGWYSKIFKTSPNMIDKKGNPVSWDDREIEFLIDGDCRFIGIENGDNTNVVDYSSKKVKTYKGKALLALQSTYKGSIIKVKVRSEDVTSDMLEIIVK